jgi:tetratricopeptide (TPR) repeat protein
MTKKFCYFLFIILLFSIPHISYGDNEEFQLKLISAKHDSIRIDLLNNEAYALRAVNPQKALKYLDLATEISMRNASIKGILNTLKVRAIVYKYIGAYDKAMDYALKAMRLAEVSQDKGQISNCYNIIGSIYQAKTNYDMAIYYFSKSAEIELVLGNLAQASIRLYNIGTVYDMNNNKDAALKLYKRSLGIEEYLKSDEGIMYALYGIGGVLSDKGDYAEAEVYLDRALALSKKYNNLSGISYCTFELGKLYMHTNRDQMAINSLTRSYQLADSISEMNQLKDVYKGLSDLYLKQGEFKLAFDFLTKYTKVYEAINNSESNTKIAELTNRYEIDKRDREYQLLLKENQIKQLEYSQTKNIRNYFFLMSIMIVVLLSVTYKKNKNSVSKSILKNLKHQEEIVQKLENLLYSKQFWVVVLNIYFLLYMVLFQPFSLIQMGWGEKSIIIAIYSSILLLISLLFVIFEQKFNNYFIEKGQLFKTALIVLVTWFLLSMFISIFNSLQLDESFSLKAYLLVLLDIVIVSIFPIIFSFIFGERMMYAQYIDKLKIDTSEQESPLTAHSNEDIELDIETDNISENITMVKSKLICVEANDNYSAVYFEKNGKIHKKLYRITLKKIESSLIIYEEFIRCHKSYIVNINHLKKITGNSQKYKMIMDLIEMEIPVSRNFPNQLLQALKDRTEFE